MLHFVESGLHVHVASIETVMLHFVESGLHVHVASIGTVMLLDIYCVQSGLHFMSMAVLQSPRTPSNTGHTYNNRSEVLFMHII